MQVSSLHIYPVKSCRGLAVLEMDIDPIGPVDDRRFLIVDANGKFLTQREHPEMAQIRVRPSAGNWTFFVDHHHSQPVDVPKRAPVGVPPREVTIWRDTVLAEDCGDEIATLLSGLLGSPVRLVRAAHDYKRTIPEKRTPEALKSRGGSLVAFGDAFPFLITSIASIGDLNSRLEVPVPMDRFRPTIVVTGCGPYEEDTWTRIQIGNVELHAAGPCGRCAIITTDQHTGERAKEPLATLSTFRRGPEGAVNFGQNFIHASEHGTIRVGDAVTILEKREAG
jgi:uncharacterized protein YcbX